MQLTRLLDSDAMSPCSPKTSLSVLDFPRLCCKIKAKLDIIAMRKQIA